MARQSNYQSFSKQGGRFFCVENKKKKKKNLLPKNYQNILRWARLAFSPTLKSQSRFLSDFGLLVLSCVRFERIMGLEEEEKEIEGGEGRRGGFGRGLARDWIACKRLEGERETWWEEEREVVGVAGEGEVWGVEEEESARVKKLIPYYILYFIIHILYYIMIYYYLI